MQSVSYNSYIVNPNPKILRQAAELIALQNGGKVFKIFLDPQYQFRGTDLVIYVPDLPRGMAIEIDPTTSNVTFWGDFWGVQDIANKFQKKVAQMYICLCVQKVLLELGYTMSDMEKNENNSIFLVGTSSEQI